MDLQDWPNYVEFDRLYLEGSLCYRGKIISKVNLIK